MPSLTLAAAVARRSFGGHGGSGSASVFDANVRKWFSGFGKIEEGSKGVQMRVKEPQGERGLYKSYCLVTFEFVGGKMEALKKGVEVSRDKNAMSEDLIALNLKPLDKGKKGNSPLSEAKCKARMEILQRAVDNYNRYTPRSASLVPSSLPGRDHRVGWCLQVPRGPGAPRCNRRAQGARSGVSAPRGE